METISKEAILSKTHYGIGIYAHILRLYYPSEQVLSLVGRTCSDAKNPFNTDKPTLKVFIEKSCRKQQISNLSEKENILLNSLDKEFARHIDSEEAIPAGDAFDFARLHYKQSDSELLQTLNEEMNLHIGKNWVFHNQKKDSISKKETECTKNEKAFAFSFFKAPIRNTIPHKTVSLLQVYDLIKGGFYKQHTEILRSISDVAQVRKYKAANFDYCTFSGVFTSRGDKSLVTHSELLCVDFDHIQNISTLWQALLDDEYFETQLLFVSPSGDGLKWIIEIDTQKAPHGEYFASVANYILQTYSVEIDKSGKDISRACFLPYDPNAYINPLLLDKDE